MPLLQRLPHCPTSKESANSYDGYVPDTKHTCVPVGSVVELGEVATSLAAADNIDLSLDVQLTISRFLTPSSHFMVQGPVKKHQPDGMSHRGEGLSFGNQILSLYQGRPPGRHLLYYGRPPTVDRQPRRYVWPRACVWPQRGIPFKFFLSHDGHINVLSETKITLGPKIEPWFQFRLHFVLLR